MTWVCVCNREPCDGLDCGVSLAKPPRKNHDRHANPLCHGHHQHDQHKRAERLFWDRVGKDAYATAAAHYAAYQGFAPSRPQTEGRG
jgi:hypothetical protein